MGVVEHVRGKSYAWLQPDGGWGLSNSGLILTDHGSLLVDTLFDRAHTARMLEGYGELTAGAPIGTVVNTHGNGDHWFGNDLVPDAEIVAAEGSLRDMRAVGPAQLRSLLAMEGPTGDYVRRIFGRYDFSDLTPAFPTRTFSGDLALTVGGVDIVLFDVGPAHTQGDTIVYCPRDRVVFSGDIVFAGGTPVVWAGPFSNWVAACERIMSLDADLLVPGHGPVCSVGEARSMVDYLQHVYDQAAVFHARGMPLDDAVDAVDLGPYADLPERERLGVNVATIYRELDPVPGPPPDGPALFGCMARLDGRCC